MVLGEMDNNALYAGLAVSTRLFMPTQTLFRSVDVAANAYVARYGKMFVGFQMTFEMLHPRRGVPTLATFHTFILKFYLQIPCKLLKMSKRGLKILSTPHHLPCEEDCSICRTWCATFKMAEL